MSNPEKPALGRDIKGLKVRDVMETVGKRQLPVVPDTATIYDVVEAMCGCRHSRVLYVVDEDERLAGAISLETLMRHIFGHSHEQHAHPRHLLRIITTESARDLMDKRPFHAGEDDDVGSVLERMIGKRVSEIAIVDNEDRIVADLTMLDLLKVCR